MLDTTPHKPHHPDNDHPDEFEPDSLPVEPDKGPDPDDVPDPEDTSVFIAPGH